LDPRTGCEQCEAPSGAPGSCRPLDERSHPRARDVIDRRAVDRHLRVGLNRLTQEGLQRISRRIVSSSGDRYDVPGSTRVFSDMHTAHGRDLMTIMGIVVGGFREGRGSKNSEVLSLSGSLDLQGPTARVTERLMDIGVSFEAGIPVLTLEGRFDGAGAIVFDEQISALDTDAVQWVIDLSGVGYLSSLGIRSLMTLEKRLKAGDGGLVLAGITPLVQKVLHVSRLEDFLRIAPTAAAGIETARTSAATYPTIEMVLGRWHAKVRRLVRRARSNGGLPQPPRGRESSCSASTQVISALPSASAFWAA
jgi:anti-sigma B factor antagonist